jgi:V8-like Glu-specific endopeptidase
MRRALAPGRRVVAATLLIALVATFAHRVVAQEEEEAFQLVHQDSRSMVLNRIVGEQSLREVRKGVFWQMPFGQMKTRYIRFHFDNIKSPPGASYSLRVLSLPFEQEVARYPADKFAQGESFMTGLLPSGELRLELAADSIPQGLSFRLERAIWRAPSGTVTVHSPIVSTMLITSLPDGSPFREPEHSVAILHIGPTEITCTAILIGEQMVATNHHCVKYSLAYQQSKQSATPSCQDIVVEFDFLAQNQRGSTANCVSLKTDEVLDVALLTLDRKASEIGTNKNRRPVKLRPASEGVPDVVRMLHHPLGFPLAIQEHCRVRKVEGTDIEHDCAPANGSSGSPIFDDQMRWVGIHYKGAYPRTWTNEKQFEDMQKNGPKYNHARAATAVMDFLKK